ncbi:hypothetical protein ACCO45_003255 [Purpureocillium lilacinum]|uniref:Uncharacterized protein n=1 Tax=Purpureocillium lilacinum TaxID=33203 RepID=A0ACC4DZE8_PURLI
MEQSVQHPRHPFPASAAVAPPVWQRGPLLSSLAETKQAFCSHHLVCRRCSSVRGNAQPEAAWTASSRRDQDRANPMKEVATNMVRPSRIRRWPGLPAICLPLQDKDGHVSIFRTTAPYG